MTPQDSLFAIAEISIGLAGFSGLVAAFVQHSGEAWRPDQKTRIVLLILLSFGMMVGALAPYALAGLSDSPALVWGAPMIGFSLLCMSLNVYWVRVARLRGFKLLFPFTSIPILTVATGLQGLVLLSGLGWVLPYSPALYVLGFLTVIVFCANMFLALLHSIWTTHEAEVERAHRRERRAVRRSRHDEP